MAAMTALQSSMASLSISSKNNNLMSSSFWGQPFLLLARPPPPSLLLPLAHGIKFLTKPCPVEMRLKRWERKECKPNSLPVLHKLHVKVGDTVKIISGREKGKIGEITRVFKHNSTVIVKDTNLKTKHMKSREQGEPGQIVKIEGPIHSSNVMLYSKENNVASRVGHKILEDGTRVRFLIKTGEIVDSAENWKNVIKERKTKEDKAS